MITPNQIYRGFEDEEIERLKPFIVCEASLGKDHYTDGFSQVTPYSSVPFIDPKNINVERLTLPVPDDGFHSEALEYISLAHAVDSSKSKGSFCVAELGAGWGPWVSLGGVMARNSGIKNIEIIAVEAQPSRFELLKKQLLANALMPKGKRKSGDCETDFDGVKTRLIQGAVTAEHQQLFFPDVDITDMGAAPSEENLNTDYRGLEVKNIAVQGYPLSEVIKDSEIDFLHIDIQGSEYDVISAHIDLVNRQVNAMMVGTHSRSIEGKLVDLLYDNGWYLKYEKPCKVHWQKNPASVTGMTAVDGCQYWLKA